jgi:hypothetical protein
MGSLFMVFVYAFFFYLIYKAIRFFILYMNEPESQKKQSAKSSNSDSRMKIKNEDIIDAEFVELKPDKKENQTN